MNENATIETAFGAGFVGRVDFRRSRSGNRLWSKELKGRIVRESLAPGARVADVACVLNEPATREGRRDR